VKSQAAFGAWRSKFPLWGLLPQMEGVCACVPVCVHMSSQLNGVFIFPSETDSLSQINVHIYPDLLNGNSKFTCQSVN
jgi:hypothetical protein